MIVDEDINAIVAADLPKATSLLTELSSHITSVQQTITGIKDKIISGELNVNKVR